MASSRNLYGLSPERISEALSPFGARPYVGRQIASHLYARGVHEFDRMTDLPAGLRSSLESAFEICLPDVRSRHASSDGTIRYVLGMTDGPEEAAEAVFIPDRGRVTLCISSQAGCALACTFCMTATLGLLRHLTAGEIAGQVARLMELHALEPNRFNLVFMGMGEPLHNFEGLVAALEILCSDRVGFGISPRRITVSTAGLAPEIERLADTPFAPRLAVSLNATTDSSRARLMPVNRKFPIDRLMDACRAYISRRRGRMDRLTLEYVLLRDVNDRPADAARLARLAFSLPARVNLIPFNATPELPFAPSGPDVVRRFRDGLLDRGVRVSVRASRGADVRAACGQLAFGERTGPGADGAAGAAG